MTRVTLETEVASCDARGLDEKPLALDEAGLNTTHLIVRAGWRKKKEKKKKKELVF